MQKLKLSQIAQALGTQISYEADICEVVTDSRKAKAGTLFVAICGENLDGNRFADSAIRSLLFLTLSERSSNWADCTVGCLTSPLLA